MGEPVIKVGIKVSPETKSNLKSFVDDIGKVVNAFKKVDPAPAEKTAKSLKNMTEAQKAAAEAADELSARISKQNSQLSYLESSIRRVVEGTKFLAGGFLGLEAVAQLRELADVAANSERLGVALQIVGQNAGYSASQVGTVDKAIQKLGFTAEQSRQGLTKYLQAGLDLNKAQQLAVIAQDASVTSGRNYAEVLQELTFAVQTGRPEMLRRIGLIVDLQKAERDLAKESTGGNVQALNQRQKSQAALNAIIEAGALIQGAYSESLKTVGGQLRDLPQQTEKLKDAIGEGLLPSYLAVISTIREVLQEFQLLADSENGTGEGAQRLGDSVKALAEEFKEVIEFAVKHRKVIEDVAVAYVLWNGGLRQAIDAVIRLSTYLPALGTGLGATGRFLGATTTGGVVLANALLAVGVALAYVAQSGSRFGDAFATPVGALLTALTAILDTLIAGFKGLVAYAIAFGQAITGNLKGAVATLAAYNDSLSESYNRTKKVADATKQLYEHVVHGGKSPGKSGLQGIEGLFGGASEKEDAHGRDENSENQVASASRKQDAFDIYTADLAKQQRADAAYQQAKKDGDDTRIAETGRKLQALNKLVGEDEEAWEKRIDYDKMSDAEKRHSQELALQGALHQRQIADLSEYGAAYDRLLKKGIATAKGLQTEGANSKLTDFQQITKANPSTGKVDVDAVRLGAQEYAKTIASDADLDGFKAAVAEAKKVPGLSRKDIQALDTSVAVASHNAAAANREFTASIVADAAKAAKDKDEKTVEQVQHEIDLQKLAAEQSSAIDKEKYANGQIGIEEYYANRQQILEAAYDKEQELSRARIRELQESEKFQTPLERRATENEIQKERDKQNTATFKLSVDSADLLVEKTKDQLDIQKQLRDIAASTASETGGLSGKLDQINDKYAEIRKKTRGQGDDIIAAAKAAEVYKATLDDLTKSQEVAQALTDANISAQKASLDLADKRGLLSPVQKQLGENDITRQQQALVLSKLQDLQKQADLTQKAIADAISLNPNADVSQNLQHLDELQTKVVGLQTEFKTLEGTIVQSGDALRNQFQTSFSNSLTNMIVNFRSAQQTLIGLGKDLEKAIIDPLAKNVTSKLFTSLTNSTSKLGPDGKPIAGTSIFDSIGNALGLGDKKPVVAPGTDEAHKSYVYVLNLDQLRSSSAKANQARADVASGKNLVGTGVPFLDDDVSSSFPLLSDFQSGAGSTDLLSTGASSALRAGVAASGSGAAALDKLVSGLGADKLIAKAAAQITGMTPEKLARAKLSRNLAAAQKSPLQTENASSDDLIPLEDPANTVNYGTTFSDPTQAAPTASGTPGGDLGDPFVGGNPLSDASLFGFARGGVVPGSSPHASADNIHAMLTAGEHIMPVEQTAKYLPILEAMRRDDIPLQSIAMGRGLRIPGFAAGGVVGGSPATAGAAAAPQFVIHPDMAKKTLGDWFNDMLATSYANR